MSDQGFIYDSAACLCCHTCEVACQEAHGLPPRSFFRKVEWVNAQRDGQTVPIPYSGACNHCQDPACVRACPGKARYFGDLDDPNSEVSRLVSSKQVFRLKEEYGTEPKVYYISSTKSKNVEGPWTEQSWENKTPNTIIP